MLTKKVALSLYILGLKLQSFDGLEKLHYVLILVEKKSYKLDSTLWLILNRN